MIYLFLSCLSCLIWVVSAGILHAATFDLLPHQSMVGRVFTVMPPPGDRLMDVARRYDMGYCNMAEANPHLDPETPLGRSRSVIIPGAIIIPSHIKREGIVVNLAELRLYYFAPHHRVLVYPVGIGSEGWGTPLGHTTITAKKEGPTWIVPKSIQEDFKKHGLPVPERILPYLPDNPLGFYCLHLGFPGYRIHGPNVHDVMTVGRRSSHGCIRMFPEDIEELFQYIPIHTPVHIIHQSEKIGIVDQEIWIEVHQPLQEYQVKNPLEAVHAYIKHALKGYDYEIHSSSLRQALRQKCGYPVKIGFILNKKSKQTAVDL